MATPVYIENTSTGGSILSGVAGALAVSPIKPSTAFNATLDVADTPVEIVAGKSGQLFYATTIVLSGDKAISTVTDATVTIYTATANDLATAVDNIFVIPIARSAQAIITPILIETPAGHFIVGQSSDTNVSVTLLGFYLND